MTENEALQWIAKLFEMPPEALTSSTSRADIPAWDSLGVLTLMAALDEEFGLVTTDEEMRTMAKAGDIVALLRQNGKLA